MQPIQKIKTVQAHNDYSLTLTFQNGEVRRFDVSPLLNASAYFRELSDIGYFRQVFADGSGVECPNGQSLCSDTLYADAKPMPAFSFQPSFHETVLT